MQAAALYTRAAEQGYVEAQMNAAWLYQHHFSDSPEHVERARRLYKAAAKQGKVRAELELGDWYFYGDGNYPVRRAAVPQYPSCWRSVPVAKMVR